MTKKPSSPSSTFDSLTSALEFIANHLTEIQTKVDKDGEVIEFNVLGYAQKRVLNGVAYSTALTLQSSKSSYDEAVQKVKLAIKSHRGDELSELQLQRAVDWAQRLEIQIAALEALLEVASDVHERKTGERFIAPKPKDTADRKFQSPALLAAKRYADGEMTLGGGVEVASEEAA
jgi:hypothetical protein